MLTFNPGQFSDPKDLGLDLRPEAMQHWLSELPLANPDHAAQHLLGMLQRLNRARIKPARRYQLLELMQPAVGALIETLRDRYIRALLPLGPTSRGRYETALNLADAAALGFILTMQELLGQSSMGGDDKRQFAGSIYWAIHHLSLKLLESYAIYAPVPQKVWGILNELYHLAESRGVHESAAANEPGETTPSTVAMVYNRSILLAIANPYQLMQEEVVSVHKFLGKLAPGCTVQPPSRDSGEGFYVDLRRDAPPRFAHNAGEPMAREPRVCDRSRLLDALSKRIQALHDGSGSGSEAIRQMSPLARRMQRDMLVRLKNSWARDADRRHERHTRAVPVTLAVGLSASHHFISSEAVFRPERDEIKIHTGHLPAQPAGLSLVPKEFDHWRTVDTDSHDQRSLPRPEQQAFAARPDNTGDVWERIYASPVQSESVDSETPATATPYQLSHWELRDESVEGLHLSCRPQAGMPVCVGEIVAYRPQGEAHNWIVGIIRWLQSRDEMEIHMGVMLLSEGARSVAVRSIKGIGKGGQYVRALIIPDTDMNAEAATLLLPGIIYDAGTELVVNMDGHLHYVRLTQLLSASKSYAQFRFRVIKIPVNEQQNVKALRALFEQT